MDSSSANAAGAGSSVDGSIGSIGRSRGRGAGGGGQRRPRARPDAEAAPQPRQSGAGLVPETAGAAPANTTHFSKTRFSDLARDGLLCAATARAIADRGHDYATDVQDRVIRELSNGDDCLVNAKTGTGKTLAFLIPAIETLLQTHKTPPPAQSVSILVVSPTRELAQQIETEALSILKHHPFQALSVVGGTNINTDLRRLSSQTTRNDILVGTPGRVLDLLQNHGLAAMCSNLRVLVLDEADRLLDEGFRPDLERILALLPDRKRVKRQTMLFSATIPPGVHQVSSLALLPNHKFISTVVHSTGATHTHVPQYLLTTTLENLLPLSLATIEHHKTQHPDHKIIVFLPTARGTGLVAELFNACNCPGLEIHSRMSQSARTKTIESFRDARSGVMFSSDVSARGIDIPNVTLVVQIGMPATAEQYIHRLGRTARAGADGEGVLILATFESRFVDRNCPRNIPSLTPHPLAANLSSNLGFLASRVAAGMARVDATTKAQFYVAWLGYYLSHLKTLSLPHPGGREALVAVANEYALKQLGCAEIPGIQRKTVGKMNLKGCPGVRVVDDEPRGGGRGGGGGGGRGGTQRPSSALGRVEQVSQGSFDRFVNSVSGDGAASPFGASSSSFGSSRFGSAGVGGFGTGRGGGGSARGGRGRGGRGRGSRGGPYY